MTVHVVGIGLDGAAGLSESARQVVGTAALLVGSDRHLSYFPDRGRERWVLEDLTEAILEIRRWLGELPQLEADAETVESGRGSIVILVAGDPLFHGWGKLLISQIPPDQLTFHPHVSSVQLAFNRLQIPWQDAHFVGSQGRYFEELTAKLKLGVEKIAVLADETLTPAALANVVKALDLPTRYQFWVCENLGSAEEKVGLYSLEALLGESFSLLSVVVMRRVFPPAEALDLARLPLLGIPDAAFICGGDRLGLTVEREVRVLVLAQLTLGPEQVVWDVGAGNGSVSIEIARLFPQSEVYAIEQTVSGTSAIELNCSRFELQNVLSIHGKAPEILHRLRPPHRIFIGGCAEGLTKILGVCALRLLAGGSIVLALDVFEDIATVLSWIGDRVRREPHWSYRILQVQLSRSISAGSLTRFDALNPISIVTIDRHLN